MLINRLVIQINTPDGTYGVDIPFQKGLNIIHAENTEGKSSCMQSIVYALGLEGALGPGRNVPLKEVLTKELDDKEGRGISVIESRIFLELENSGKKITVSRSSNVDKKDLINVWEDFIFTNDNVEVDPKDYYVRYEGAASRERGFHSYLAKFINLELPVVMKYDGKKCPLYLETLFSLFYVEQRNGWGGIQNLLPKYLGIKDVGVRALEFVLGLECFENDERKHDVNQEIKIIADKWENVRTRAEFSVSKVSGVLSDIPERPVINFKMQHVPAVIVLLDNVELELSKATTDLERQLVFLKSRQIPQINKVQQELETQLQQKLEQYSELEQSVGFLMEEYEHNQAYVGLITKRTEQIDDDLYKYKDLRRLLKIGSSEDFKFPNNVCPTCGQSVDDSLLQHTHNHEVLTIEENIDYLTNQRKSLENLLKVEESRLKKHIRTVEISNNKLAEIRSSIRTLKESLISDGRIPSKEAIKEELNLESKIELFKSSMTEFNELVNRLEGLSEEYEAACAKLTLLPKDRLSDADKDKLSILKRYFKNNLKLFGYTSTGIDEFNISEYTFKPVIDEVELSFEASASDNIRIVWAYLYSLLQLSSDTNLKTNHLNLLLLDEPRQQEAREDSFASFINLVSETSVHDQQIIITTSEKYSELTRIVGAAKHHVKMIHFDGKIFDKVPT